MSRIRDALMILEFPEEVVECGMVGAVLVEDDPCNEEIDLLVLPKVNYLVLIVFKEYEVDHLAEILEVGSHCVMADVLHH